MYKVTFHQYHLCPDNHRFKVFSSLFLISHHHDNCYMILIIVRHASWMDGSAGVGGRGRVLSPTAGDQGTPPLLPQGGRREHQGALPIQYCTVRSAASQVQRENGGIRTRELCLSGLLH